MTTRDHRSHSLIARLAPDERIAGYYRYVASARRPRHDGHTMWRIQLADRSGVLDTYVARTLATPVDLPPTGQLAYAEFRTHAYRGRVVAELRELDTLIPVPDTASVVDRLPITAACDSQALTGLAQLLNDLAVPALRHFADRVLAQDALALAWIGDAQQRFQQALIAAHVAAQMPYFEAQERDLIVIGALFRNLGQVVVGAVSSGNGPASVPSGVPPGVLTLERCATALAWLEQAWPHGAGCLRQIWAGPDGDDRHAGAVLGHAVRLMTRIAQGDVRGARWLATQRTRPQ